MKLYHIHVLCGGIQVSISAMKNDTKFFQTLSKAIYDKLPGVHFMTKVYNYGVILESNNIPDSFLGTTIPFVFMSRKLELQVYPEALDM